MTAGDRNETLRKSDRWSSPQTADRAYDWLAGNADATGEVTGSLRELSDELGVHFVTASRAVRRLEEEHPPRLVRLRRGTSRDYGSRFRIVGVQPAAAHFAPPAA